MRERNTSDIQRLETDIERTRAEIDKDIDEIEHRLSPEHLRDETEIRIHHVREVLSEKVSELSHKITGEAQRLGSQGARKIKQSVLPLAVLGAGVGWSWTDEWRRSCAQESEDQFRRSILRHPVASGLIAAAAGAAAALLVPVIRRKDETLEEVDEAVRAATATARDVKKAVQEP